MIRCETFPLTGVGRAEDRCGQFSRAVTSRAKVSAKTNWPVSKIIVRRSQKKSSAISRAPAHQLSFLWVSRHTPGPVILLITSVEWHPDHSCSHAFRPRTYHNISSCALLFHSKYSTGLRIHSFLLTVVHITATIMLETWWYGLVNTADIMVILWNSRRERSQD